MVFLWKTMDFDVQRGPNTHPKCLQNDLTYTTYTARNFKKHKKQREMITGGRSNATTLNADPPAPERLVLSESVHTHGLPCSEENPRQLAPQGGVDGLVLSQNGICCDDFLKFLTVLTVTHSIRTHAPRRNETSSACAQFRRF